MRSGGACRSHRPLRGAVRQRGELVANGDGHPRDEPRDGRLPLHLVELALEGLVADADLLLVDEYETIIGSSEAAGNASEYVQQIVPPGRLKRASNFRRTSARPLPA